MSAMSSYSDQSGHLSWSALISAFRETVRCRDVDCDKLVELFSQYRSNEEDWSMFAFFQDNVAYTRNLVDAGNGFYNLMVLAWNPGKGCCIHDHAGAKCVVKVLSGTITEIRYETPEEGKDLAAVGEFERGRDEVCCMDDSMGVHEMQNKTQDPAVTLHLYAPPFDRCNAYTCARGPKALCEMRFASIYGVLGREEGSEEIRPYY